MAISYDTTYDTAIATGAAQTVNIWEARLVRDMYKKGFWNKFMGKGEEYTIHVKENFIKEPGDKLKFDLAIALSSAGRTGSQQMVDNEEVMSESQDEVKIDFIRNAVRSGDPMSRQRPAFWKSSAGKDRLDGYRRDAKNRLAAWWAEIVMDTKIANFLCGATETFANTAHAPTTGRVLYAGGVATSTATITAADKFGLDMIDDAVTMAKVRYSTAVPRINPAKVNGLNGLHYIVVLHPFQVRDMRQNVSTGQWLDITKAAGLRGDVNRIFAGVQVNFVGWHNGCAIFEHDSIQTETDWGAGGDVEGACGLFLGAQAGIFAWCMYPNWVEELFDYKAKFGVSTGGIWGMDKTQFTISGTAYDFATIALRTAAKS